MKITNNDIKRWLKLLKEPRLSPISPIPPGTVCYLTNNKIVTLSDDGFIVTSFDENEGIKNVSLNEQEIIPNDKVK